MSTHDSPGYAPADITPPELQPAGIAASIREGWIGDLVTDPTQITDWPDRQSRALIPFRVVTGYPRNPAGRTGRIGRNLKSWGENQAADPIVITGAGRARRVLLIRRDDCGQWAIPGGMVDPGETAPAALARELREETGVNLAGITPTVLARVYVDDPRNTDWAWVTSTVALFHIPTPATATAGSDATDAQWWPFTDLADLYTALHSVGEQLYPPHEALLNYVPTTRAGETEMAWFTNRNIAMGNARVGIQIGDSSSSHISGTFDAETGTLTYTCPNCGRDKAHRGDAFAHGIREHCGCGHLNNVYVS